MENRKELIERFSLLRFHFFPTQSTDSLQTQSEFLISYSYDIAKLVLKSNGKIRNWEEPALNEAGQCWVYNT